eukprot:9571415-Heterocapsa_arctica.AAC.1
MIGLMADDIEATPGYNKRAAREPDEMLLKKELRDVIAGRHMQFFGTTNPTADEMYTCRGQMAAEVTKQLKLSQAAAHRGREHQTKLPA